MAEAERILIVGGGIGGLTLAAALNRHGFTAELIERSRSWRAVGAGIAVQPNGLRILNAVGLGAAVEQQGTVIRHWDFCDDRGEVLCATDLEALWADVGPFIGISRGRLQQALLPAIALVDGRPGTSIAALNQDGRSVSVQFSDGSSGTYDLVVGADGIASAVRTLAMGGDPPVYGGQMVWRSLAPVRPRGLTRLQLLLGDGCFFGLCPVGDGQTYGFGIVTSPRFRDEPRGRLDRLRQRFASFGPIVEEYLAAVESDDRIHCSPIEWVEREIWYSGRVVLIGDASHATWPMVGQGGSLAMEDAFVLAETLRSADSVERAVEEYVRRRTPRVQWVREQSRAAAEGLRLPVAARNEVLRARGDQMMKDRFRPLIDAP